jgi:hypothetical protein
MIFPSSLAEALLDVLVVNATIFNVSEKEYS